MSLRFIIGACVSAIVNMLISIIFFMNHEAMAHQPTWEYVLTIPFYIWWFWFATAGLIQLCGIYYNSAATVRYATGVGIVAKAVWTAFFFLVIFDPRIRNASGMAQLLTGAVMAFEFVFLALPNTPRLDEVIRRTTKERTVRKVR